MVLAAALISLAVLAPPAPSQAAPQAASQAKPQAERQPAPTDDSKPYTVDGVRRAIDRRGPALDRRQPLASPTGAATGWRSDSRAINPDPCSLVVTACQPAWRGGANPTWHDQFIAMTGPQNYLVPYTGMNNSQRLQAVASSIVINLALQAVVSVIRDQIVKTSTKEAEEGREGPHRNPRRTGRARAGERDRPRVGSDPSQIG